MKSYLSLSAALILMSAAAAPAVAQETGSWTGFYAGGRLGYTFAPKDKNEYIGFDTNSDGNFNNTVRTAAGADAFAPGFCDGAVPAGQTSPNGAAKGRCGARDKEGVDFAGHVGFDYQVGSNIVVGLVGEYGRSTVDDSVTAFSTTPAAYTMTRSFRGTAAVRARAGYALGNTLFYGTGGGAYARVRSRFGTSNNANSFTNPDGSDARQNAFKHNDYGYTYGGGIEQKIGAHFSIGAQYLYTSIKDKGYDVVVGKGTAPVTNPFINTAFTNGGTVLKRQHSKFNTRGVSVTASYRF